LRSDGIRGDGSAQFAWRWAPTAEERLLAESGPAPVDAPALEDAPAGTPVPPSSPEEGRERTSATDPPPPDAGAPVLPASACARAAAHADPAAPARPVIVGPVWAGVRGAVRDSRVVGVRIGMNWNASPPSELWHRPVGPAWSSFAVRGARLYTQEQRGKTK